MEYEMEELVPIVGRLAEKYTSKESTSISYEKAQQLMEAVLYCIGQAEQVEKYTLVSDTKCSAQKMYEIGAMRVEEKVKKALQIYNKIIPYFSSYGNKCLYDTFVKGIPEFFKWYDYSYAPQNTILTLDYPVLKDLSGYTGIDRIYEFLICVCQEQKFLMRFPDQYVEQVLWKYNKSYQTMIDNICEIVLGDLLLQRGFCDSQEQLQHKVERLAEKYYDHDRELQEYLLEAVPNIAVRMKISAVYGNL